MRFVRISAGRPENASSASYIHPRRSSSSEFSVRDRARTSQERGSCSRSAHGSNLPVFHRDQRSDTYISYLPPSTQKWIQKGGPSALIPGRKFHKTAGFIEIVSSTKLCHSFYHKPENLTTLFYFPFFSYFHSNITWNSMFRKRYRIVRNFQFTKFLTMTKQPQNFLPVRAPAAFLSPFSLSICRYFATFYWLFSVSILGYR